MSTHAGSALAQLSADWQDWVRLNLARGCAPDGMRDLLHSAGGFAPELAAAALDEAASQRHGGPQPPTAPPTAARPQPHIAANGCELAGQAVRVSLVLQQPQLVVFENLLTEPECRRLIAQAESRAQTSTVIDDHSGAARLDPHRSSLGASFTPAETPEIALIEARIAALLGWPASHAEGLQVMRYDVGGEYRAHFDYFDPAKSGSHSHLSQAGQRVGTLVIYLCDVPLGGGTLFPSLGLEVRPRCGGAVYFANVDATGAIDPSTLHAGAPVHSGLKYIATKWLRERAWPVSHKT